MGLRTIPKSRSDFKGHSRSFALLLFDKPIVISVIIPCTCASSFSFLIKTWPLRFRERDSKLFVDSCRMHFEPPLGVTLFKFNQDHWRELIDSFGHVRRCFSGSSFSGFGRIPSCHGAIWTDRQTDRQADGWTTAYTGRAGIMSRRKNYTQRPSDTKQGIAPGAVRRYAPPPMAVRLAADLRPSADGSAVGTWLSLAAGSRRAYGLRQLRA